MKVCTVCSIAKELTEFRTRKDRPSGIKSLCKKCEADYDKARRKPNKVATPTKSRAERQAIATAKWRKENPDKRRSYEAARRARKNMSVGVHTAEDLQEILELQGNKCAVCATCIKSGSHADHIVPLARGGSNDKLNIQMLCRSCNCKKHAKDPIDFMQSRGFLL